MKSLVIAGTTSGVGKTTVAVGLMAALRLRGLRVQPFKTGPDYIDPGYHTRATGEISRNLDSWLLSRDTMVELYTRATVGKDIAVIEGVMGLFDGHSSTEEDGSTAELAKLLGVPVILVVDSRKSARSLAAMVGGYHAFDAGLKLSGVILNGIGSQKHLQLCTEAIEHYTGIPVLGHLPRRSELTLPERHLGLVPANEDPADPEFFARLGQLCTDGFDIPRILQISKTTRALQTKPGVFPAKKAPPVARIAVATDEAFSFYYQDSLELLQAFGAELLEFSPLRDGQLPHDVSGLYFGGGFPELHAVGLAANNRLKRQIRIAIDDGIPAYAECGGLMYLGENMRDFEGNEHEMVGSLPVSSQINSPRLSLGYRTVQALNDGPLLQKGETARGHEFHWSVLNTGGNSANAYCLLNKEDTREGFQSKGLLASYVHLHLCGIPGAARRFVEACAKYRRKHL
jgi:cobyrinic acid a,c-diamide synthase